MRLLRYITNKIFRSKRNIAITIVVVVLVGTLIYYWTRPGNAPTNSIAVTRGNIVETVTVTGNTKPLDTISLGFEAGGTIAHVSALAGDHVNAGSVLVALDTTQLSAQLNQATANVTTQQAKLDALVAGAIPEDIQVSKTQLEKAAQDLANDYLNVGNSIQNAYSKANDAVRNQIAPLFSSAETSNPSFTFQTNDSQSANTVIAMRIQSGAELNNWITELQTINAVTPNAKLDVALVNAVNHLSVIQTFLNRAMSVVVNAQTLPASTAATYQTDITAALTEISTAITNITQSEQAIASQKVTVKQLQDELNLKLAGSTSHDIAAQSAQVEQARASAENINAQIKKATLVTPISGTVTVQNAKVGEIASPGNPLVTLISTGNLEIEANIPETDIGKIVLNDKVDITLDAFHGETFNGKVIHIDPAETIVDGVVDYKIKVTFDTPDARLKSGLTSNLAIETTKKSGVLILPQIAVLEKDAGTFVRVRDGSTYKEIPVTLGIRDQNGNIEITSGVSEGEQVMNVALKSQ